MSYDWIVTVVNFKLYLNSWEHDPMGPSINMTESRPTGQLEQGAIKKLRILQLFVVYWVTHGTKVDNVFYITSQERVLWTYKHLEDC